MALFFLFMVRLAHVLLKETGPGLGLEYMRQSNS